MKIGEERRLWNIRTGTSQKRHVRAINIEEVIHGVAKV